MTSPLSVHGRTAVGPYRFGGRVGTDEDHVPHGVSASCRGQLHQARRSELEREDTSPETGAESRHDTERMSAVPLRIVVGATGLVGRQLVALLERDGHRVVAASPSTGVDAARAPASRMP